MAESNGVDTGPAAEPDWGKFLDGINRLNDNVTELRQSVAQPAPAPAPREEPPAERESALEPLPNFAEMTQGELAQWFLGHTDRVSKTVVDRVAEMLQGQQQAQQQTHQEVLVERYTRELETLAAEHKDLRDWNDEMVAIVNENPGITPLRALQLARAESPEKAAKLTAKYNPPPEPKPKPFSFAPGGTGAGGTTQPKAVSKEDAFKTAFEKVRAKWGDEALGALTGNER